MINLSDPLNTTTGNPDLKPSNNINSYFSFGNYDWNTRSGYYLGFSFYKTINPIVSSTVFNEDFKSNTTFINLDNQDDFYIYSTWSKNFKKEKRNFKISTNLNLGYNFNEGIINNIAVFR